MYDELVKRLRYEDLSVFQMIVLLDEAADAIEELSKYADAIRKLKCEGWYLQQTKYRDGYHAIATMPLPDPPKEETC